MKMHVEEIPTDPDLVRRLLTVQFRKWARLPIVPVSSTGTVHALYRLGNEMLARLPKVHWGVDNILKEQRWLPFLGPRLPLPIPVPLAIGAPGEGFPFPWSVFNWLPGDSALNARITDMNQAARDLASFLLALHQIDPEGGPPADENPRALPLIVRDDEVREAISQMSQFFPEHELTAAWEAALAAPNLDKPSVWLHGDMMPGNLLFQDGKLSAVIDFSAAAVGDPACDLMIAWNFFSGESRAAFREALGMDDATWARGRGHALAQALIFIPYYLRTNPLGVGLAKHTVKEILAEQAQ